MPMNDELDAYQTYVPRLWRARCEGRWQWRASIEGPRPGERQWFAGLEQMFAYLREQCERQVPHPPDATGTIPENPHDKEEKRP